MILKIAICDDDRSICDDLEDVLGQIAESNDCEFEVSIFTSGEEFHRHFVETDQDFDAVFLDIELSEEKNGVYIGNAIKNEFFKETKLVYVSSYAEYALELFKTHPFDFIVKSPEHKFVYGEIEDIVMAIAKLISKQNKPFEYQIGNAKYEIDLYKILYFCSLGRKVEVHTLKRNIENNVFYGKISEIGRQLEKSDFFFVHRAFLVNYHGVAKFEYDKLTLVNGEALYIAQAYRKTVRAMRMGKMGEK
ncbi:MAG: LytTR family DNA-binding domain-containing protein [Oscillospiraceae bacterium]|nr:LytTR family DNA-binding domain-containing protein [Oscillospiraceae bacterium]